MKKCLYFLPVQTDYIDRWEYYVVDENILNDIFSNVTKTNSYLKAFIYVFTSDVVYCWWWHRSLPIILLCKLLRKKVYVTGAIHMFDQKTSIDFYGKKSFLFRMTSRLALKFSDANLFISRDQFQAITSHIKVNNPCLVYSSLSKNFYLDCNFDFNLKKKIYKKEKIKIGFLGWLQDDQLDRKGLYLIIDAIRKLNLIENKYELIIAGKSGSAVKHLMQIVNELSANIKIKLDLSARDKEDFYREINIFANPSSYEGFGNATLEAMSYGVPAIVTRFGASWEVVGDSGAILMDIDSDQVLNAIRKISYRLENDKEQLVLDIKNQLSKYHYNTRLESIKKIINSK